MAIRENLLVELEVCAPGTVLIEPEGDAAADAAVLKVVADPTRLSILRLLAANGAVCACDLESPLGLSQPTVSHHLRQLHEAGLVTREKRGTWAFFSLDREAVARAAGALTALGG